MVIRSLQDWTGRSWGAGFSIPHIFQSSPALAYLAWIEFPGWFHPVTSRDYA